MTPRERVWAALQGEPLDRPPISFWGHFYHRESSARDLVDATMEFQSRYAWDWVKLNPRKHYHVEPWGVRYKYPGRPGEKPKLESWPIHTGSDWRRIDERPHDQGALGEQLEAVRMLRDRLPLDVPLIETVFTPLAILGEMVKEPKELVAHMHSHPEDVRHALASVTATFERFVRAVLDAGADGIYLATVDWASRDIMSLESYQNWARPGDLALLAAAPAAPFNVLHVCRRNNFLAELADYPVAAVSWDSAAPGNLTLRQAHATLKPALMCGIAHEGALQRDDPDAVVAELREGFEATQGRRWLVAPSCSIPPTTLPDQLDRLRSAVEDIASPRSR